MLKSSATVHALVVSLVLAILCLSIILASQLSSRVLQNLRDDEQMMDNCNSGINLLLAGFGSDSLEGGFQYRLFEQGFDTVSLKWRQWGVYKVVSVTSKIKERFYMKSAFVGQYLYSQDSLIGYFADLGEFLHVSDDANLIGTLAVPGNKIMASLLPLESQDRSIAKRYTTLQSNKTLPFNFYAAETIWHPYLCGDKKPDDIALDFKSIKSRDVSNSFADSTMILQSSDGIILQNLKISGNIIIRSDSSITVLPSAILKDIILLAPEIHILAGTRGTMQLISSGFIKVDSLVELKYPSGILHIADSESGLNSHVEIESHSQFKGAVILTKNSLQSNSTLVINKDARVLGMVYCETAIENKGLISGKIYTNGIFMQTATSYYGNHVGKCEISFLKNPHFASPILGYVKGQVCEVISWLE